MIRDATFPCGISMEFFKYENKDEAKEAAGKALNGLLESNKGLPILLLVSGGSALGLLERAAVELQEDRVTVGMLDERFSADPSVNNFLQFQTTGFYQRAKNAGAHFIETVPHKGEIPSVMAERFEKTLRSWKEKNPEGKVIITQGVGHDGHTAGIMPYSDDPEIFQKLFGNEAQWVVGYDAGNKNQYPFRVTVTLPFLRNEVDATIVYVVGGEKQNVLERVLSTNGTLSETSARVIRDMRSARVFTDIS